MQLFHKWKGLRLELAQYTAEHNILITDSGKILM